MDEFDITYGALKEYQDKTNPVEEIKAFLEEMHNENNRDESLECSSSICKIDRDWVDEISRGLPFVIDAVMENRQFVRSDGEVVPIEKVRTVGKDTVVDLSKHSNYITRDPASTNGKIIPDKLMMPQKDNDFAIYENRFLYSLLIYLSQFIEIRLNEIIKITGQYEAKTKIKKTLSTPLRKLSFELNFEDIHLNDPFASKRSSSEEAINTIKTCLNQTKSLLMTPLMKEVSKAAMVHPPIVKTNIFRFDHNFKESLALYNFLQSYDKKGFTVEQVTTKISPFPTKMSENFAILVYLTGYMTYVYGNKIEDSLKKNYLEEEKRKKEAENKKLLADLKRISKNIKESSLSPEEYVMMLQKGTQILEKQLSDKEEEVNETKQSVSAKVKQLTLEFQEELKEEKEKMEKTIEEKVNELALNSLTKVKEYSEKMKQMQNSVDKTNQEKLTEISKVNQAMYRMDSDYKKKMSDLQSANAKSEKALQQQIDASNQELIKAQEEIKALKDNQLLLEGQIHNLRAMNKEDPLKDFTEEEFFNELEKEKIAFDHYFEKTWKETKKRIRKETLKLDKDQIKKDVQQKKMDKSQKREERKQNRKAKKMPKEEKKEETNEKIEETTAVDTNEKNKEE